MPSRNPYCLTWVSLTLDVGYLFTAAPAMHSHSSLPWMRGIYSRLPLLTLSSSSRPSCACVAATPWTKPCRVGPPKTDGSWWSSLTECGPGEGNCKPLQYSCLENPMNSMRRQNDRTLKEELPRSVGAQCATGDQWRNNSRKNEGLEPKQKQYPVVNVTGDRSKV